MVTCISGFGSCFGFGFCLVFVILFHTKENKLFLLSITCVETSEWSEEQNRDCYPLYKSHLDAGSELKIKMSMTLALFFLPCPTVQQEGRYQALVWAAQARQCSALKVLQYLWHPGFCWYAKALGGAAEQKLKYQYGCRTWEGQNQPWNPGKAADNSKERQVLGGVVMTPSHGTDNTTRQMWGKGNMMQSLLACCHLCPLRWKGCKLSCSPLGRERCHKGLWCDEQSWMSAQMWATGYHWCGTGTKTGAVLQGSRPKICFRNRSLLACCPCLQ